MIRILHTLGGCGGTLLSRCIGVLPNVALFSEINPASVKLFPSFDPLYQDRNWVHLLNDSDMERFSQADLAELETFRRLIAAFYARAEETGRHLVLRDYNFIDFVGLPFCTQPSRRFVLYDGLPQHIPTMAVAFIRHPIDQWSSLCKHNIVQDVLRPAHFCDAYEQFLKSVSRMSVHKYEDFVENPESSLRAIAVDLGLEFDPSFKHQFHLFDSVTGDFSRQKETSITPPAPRVIDSRELHEFRTSGAFKRILAATGYPATVDRR